MYYPSIYEVHLGVESTGTKIILETVSQNEKLEYYHACTVTTMMLTSEAGTLVELWQPESIIFNGLKVGLLM